MSVPSNTQDNQIETTNSKATNDKDYNFSQIRKQLEQERYARQQAEERAAKAEESAKRSVTNDDDDVSSDEPYVDHKSLEKRLKKAAPQIKEDTKREIREELRQEFEQKERDTYLEQNNDFNEVMSTEMMQKFVERNPKLAKSILRMPDGFERQKLVYENIKALGLHKKEEPKQSIQETVDKNRRSPYYQPSGIGTSPYAGAGDFSPAGQKSAYSKLQELKSKLRI